MANSVRTVLVTAPTRRQGGAVIRHVLLKGCSLRARNEYAQEAALLSDLLEAQCDLADADLHTTRALLDLATAQADLEKAIGEDE